MKLYSSLIFLLLPFYAFSMTDAQYEKWLHRIYLKHYKDPISYSDWNDKIQNLPKTYQLKFKDNFWDLSGDWFKNSLYWSKIWVVNPEVENPHRIHKGNFIKLDPLTLSSAVNAPFSVDISDQFQGLSAPPDFSKPALKEEEMPPSLPDIPLLNFKSELDFSKLDAFKPPNKLYIPYYISDTIPSSDGSIAAAESYGRFFGVKGDSVILRLSRNTSLGTYFTVFDTAKLSFCLREYQIQIKAVLKVTSYIQGSGLYKAQIVTALEPILLEDSLFKGPPLSYTFSKTKLGGSSGEIIGSPYGDISILSTGQLVYLNKGSNDDLYVEDSFYIVPKVKTGPLFKRPYSYEGSYVGILKVIRTTQDKSTAVILSAKESIYIGDQFTGLMKPIDLEPIEEAESLERGGQKLLEDFEEVVETPPDFIDENIQDPRNQKDEDLLEEFHSEEKDDLFDGDFETETTEDFRGKNLDKDREDNLLKQEFQFLIENNDLEEAPENNEPVEDLEDKEFAEETEDEEPVEDLEDKEFAEETEDEEPIEDLEDKEFAEEPEDEEPIEDLEDKEFAEEPEDEEPEDFENENLRKKPANELEELEEIDVL